MYKIVNGTAKRKKGISNILLIPEIKRAIGLVLPQRPDIQARLAGDADGGAHPNLVLELPQTFKRSGGGALDAQVVGALHFKRRGAYAESQANKTIRVVIVFPQRELTA